MDFGFEVQMVTFFSKVFLFSFHFSVDFANFPEL